MKKTYTVNGMKCVHCKANVENAIKALAGVNEAEADLAEKNVTVDFDENTVNFNDIKKVVENCGKYELKL